MFYHTFSLLIDTYTYRFRVSWTCYTIMVVSVYVCNSFNLGAFFPPFLFHILYPIALMYCIRKKKGFTYVLHYGNCRFIIVFKKTSQLLFMCFYMFHYTSPQISFFDLHFLNTFWIIHHYCCVMIKTVSLHLFNAFWLVYHSYSVTIDYVQLCLFTDSLMPSTPYFLASTVIQ